MALGHAAAEFVDEFARGDASGRELDAGIFHPARDRKAAEAFALMPALRGEPIDPALDNVAHPEQRLDILFERGAAEQPNLSDVRRAMSRQAALTFDRFDHGGFFAADISAGAAAQVDPAVVGEPGLLRRGDLLRKEQPYLWIFIANVNVSLGGLDHPGRDQRAFDEPMRITFEIESILERAGLAFVGIDGEQPRRGFGAHQRPFASGGKTGAAKTAQTSIADDFDDLVAAALAIKT